MQQPPSLSERSLALSSLRRWVDPRAIVWPEGLDQSKISKTPWKSNRDIPSGFPTNIVSTSICTCVLYHIYFISPRFITLILQRTISSIIKLFKDRKPYVTNTANSGRYNLVKSHTSGKTEISLENHWATIVRGISPLDRNQNNLLQNEGFK